MVEILKALADENRLKIIEMLLEKKYCVRAISVYLDISEPGVSQHLKVLKSCGLVTGKKDGYFMHYRVNEEKIAEASEYLKSLINKNPEDFRKNNHCHHGERTCK